MTIKDIANVLANRVNQAHYIEQYLKKIELAAYRKGVADVKEQLTPTAVVQPKAEKVCDHEWTHNSRTGEKYCRFENCGKISD